jgi:hypothetical protein
MPEQNAKVQSKRVVIVHVTLHCVMHNARGKKYISVTRFLSFVTVILCVCVCVHTCFHLCVCFLSHMCSEINTVLVSKVC